MDMMMAGVGMLMNFFFVGLIVAIVMKLFQIHSTLTEIKEELAKAPVTQAAYAPPPYTQPPAAQRVAPQPPPAKSIFAQPAASAPSVPQPTLRVAPPSAPPEAVAPMVGDTRSGEELLRELDAQMRMD
jgi:predicted lipid-binding transport protein (Tim44 family)